MPEKNTGLTVWALWQKCWQGSGRREQKVFWSDIVMFMKNYPGKADCFSELLKKSGVKGYAGRPLTAPPQVLVKKLFKQAEGFIPGDWQDIINTWHNTKSELKIKIQAALLQKNNLIKNFLLAVLTDCKNKQTLLAEIVKESGLLPQYPKGDIILMLCVVVAESLSEQAKEKEPDIMSEKIVTDEVEVAAEVTLHAGGNGGPAADILQGCLAALRAADPVTSEWSELEALLKEIGRTVETKGGEKEKILARNKLMGAFTGKLAYLSDVFLNQLNALAMRLPARAKADNMSNGQLSDCIDIFDRLQIILPRYKEITEKKVSNILEEKNRIALLLGVVTEIESIASSLAVFIESAADNERPPVFIQQEEERANGENTAKEPPHIQNNGSGEDDCDDEQIELFIGN